MASTLLRTPCADDSTASALKSCSLSRHDSRRASDSNCSTLSDIFDVYHSSDVAGIACLPAGYAISAAAAPMDDDGLVAFL